MMTLLGWIAGVLIVFQACIGLAFFVSSVWENERRASIFGALQLLGMIGLAVIFFYLLAIRFFETEIGGYLLIIGLLAAAGGIMALIWRTSSNPRALKGTYGAIVGEVRRVDERLQVFARNRSIRPHSEQYEIFYQNHPELEEYDAHRREKGGPLGQPGAIDRPHSLPNVAATLASLSIPMHLSAPDIYHPQQHPAFGGQTLSLSREEATTRVKGYALSLGADLVGIAEINPLWVYSHRGEIFDEEWENWGAQIELEHPYAVVFAEEMEVDPVGTAPHTPTTIESMRNYAKGAFIATQLAGFIANLGYSATANHLRHYDTVLVPLAVDAGLGEVGRLGYLLTKKYGPRIRLSAVTTDLPLVPDAPVDIGVEDFCGICKKCGVCCPSKSIPLDDIIEVNGTLRWKLNAETCFDYWGKVGTDCNICMRVCPWSHADTLPHRLIKWLVSRNKISRRLFSVMDDIFYGKNPKPRSAEKWAHFKAGEPG